MLYADDGHGRRGGWVNGSVRATAPTPQSSHDLTAWAWLCAELQRERERRCQAEANAVAAHEWAIAAEQGAAAEWLVMVLRSERMVGAPPWRWWWLWCHRDTSRLW